MSQWNPTLCVYQSRKPQRLGAVTGTLATDLGRSPLLRLLLELDWALLAFKSLR